MLQKIEAYFAWCKAENLVKDYCIEDLAAHRISEKTWKEVVTIVAAAKRLAIGRRDLFLAIGSSDVADIVGFAAAVYRRSTPWIWVPTDICGIIRCPVVNNKMSIHYAGPDDTVHRDLLALCHPPRTRFYDTGFLASPNQRETRAGLVKIIDIAVHADMDLFIYLETWMKQLLSGDLSSTYFRTAVERASRVAVAKAELITYESDYLSSSVKLRDEIENAVKSTDSNTRFHDDTEYFSTMLAFGCALSCHKGKFGRTDLKRVLDLLAQAGLPLQDEWLEASRLLEPVFRAIESRGELRFFITPVTIGKCELLMVEDVSYQDLIATLSLLSEQHPGLAHETAEQHAVNLNRVTASEKISSEEGYSETGPYEQTSTDDTSYFVVSVMGIFSPANTTLIQNCCTTITPGRKRKVLVVVDDHLNTRITSDIDIYFKVHNYALDTYRILSMHVTSAAKSMASVFDIVEAGLELQLSPYDIIVVVGGGTLMDIAGFAASMLKGGIPYLRIPTTLVGMIDAGIGIKVGVDFGNHKSLIGHYYAPVGCLNDPETFLATLPRREFACGLAESVKMAILASPRLFDLIEKYHRTGNYNNYTQELMQISIRSMLWELQSNLYEHNLRRLVDFGHEFGHIVESLAGYEIPHGECVSIGMSISSHLAWQKGIMAEDDMERILRCLLDLGLPIYTTDHDCCNPRVLWDRIRTDGTANKDGMLWLAVPEAIGRGAFLDHITDIDVQMVQVALTSLSEYQNWYKAKHNIFRGNGGLVESKPNGLKHCINSDTETTTGPSTGSKSPGITHTMDSRPQGKVLSFGHNRSFPLKGRGPMTASIIGASGDIGLNLALHLLQNNVHILASIRPSSLLAFVTRVGPHMNPGTKILTGDLLNLSNLRTMIQNSDVLYNMAGIVSLRSKPEDVAHVIAVNGFAQGVITHLVRQLGREESLKVIFPSSQRVHLTVGNVSVDAWVQQAAKAFTVCQDALVAESSNTNSEDVQMLAALERLAADFLTCNPLPAGFNVYEVSKRLGEHFVSLLPDQQRVCVRISSVYGPSFTRGFMHRALYPGSRTDGKNAHEVPEIRDFIYVNDLVEVLWKAAQTRLPAGGAFDAASGESWDLKEVWNWARDFFGDHATFPFGHPCTDAAVAQGHQYIHLDPTFAQDLLGRDFTSIHDGMRKTITGDVEAYQGTSQPALGTVWHFERSTHGFLFSGERNDIAGIMESCLNRWSSKLSINHQDLLAEHLDQTGGLYIRLRTDLPAICISNLSVQTGYHPVAPQAFIDINADLLKTARHPSFSLSIFDIIGREGHRLLAFLLRGRRPLSSRQEIVHEKTMAAKWQDFLRPWEKPYVIALDVGATYIRVGIVGPHGGLVADPIRELSPGKQMYPEADLATLQEKLLDVLVSHVHAVRSQHTKLSLEEVAISLGAVTTRKGTIQDASILWGETSHGYDFRRALQKRLPDLRLSVLNDVSAAAWRYNVEGRFCLVTVSSGLSNKVFDQQRCDLRRVDVDDAGVGGEMGHVLVEPRAVDKLVQHAISRAARLPREFENSALYKCVNGNAHELGAPHLRVAIRERDQFALRLLDEVDVPHCACGNIADLCSYSSGRAALRYAKRLAIKQDHGVHPSTITDDWLREATLKKHPLALEVLRYSTYPLALRILQLAADIGLDKFIIVGGFVTKIGKSAYLRALQDHLVYYGHTSAFFGGWTEERVRRLVRLGQDDENDGILGMGHFVHNLRSHYRVIEKQVGHPRLTISWRPIPSCGAREVLTKVVYTGLCTTDLQLLRGERGQEPTVLGHEGVLEVLEVGEKIEGLAKGEKIVLNPNNPLDDHDKLGHNIEGIFREYFKFGQEFIDRRQVLKLGRLPVGGVYTLVEPLSCVIAATGRISDRVTGRNVLIVGAGLMGLMFVTACGKLGAQQVFLANRSRERLDSAIASQIVSDNHVFVVEDCIETQVNHITAGQGVDVVIICVSLGHGISATQDAMAYINSGGCIYLFAGFSPGDMLDIDGSEKVDLWDVRSGWKTERVQKSGKPLDLMGHRGSRNHDLAMAAELICLESSAFERLVSHNISFNEIPGALLALAEDGSYQGLQTRRVVVDMAAGNRMV
ncbi:hypothetical protein PG988_015113 [Apiospora saccharicola]